MTIPNTRELTERIFTDLDALPAQIGAMELDTVDMRHQLRDAERALENAELDAVINAVIDGKNETVRKQQERQAITNSITAQAAKDRVNQLQAQIGAHEVNTKTLMRQYQAAMAMAELQAARLNMMAKYTKQPQGVN